MEKEIWKQVTGFENYYISNLGNVKSIKKGSSKILKLGSATNGYKQITLCNNGVRKLFKIHHLVAFEFLNHKPYHISKLVINHINNDRTDNRLSNLELVTQRENTNKKCDNYSNKLSSKFAGVSFCNQRKKFKSGIMIVDKSVHLGYYESELEAHNVYLNAIKIIDEYNGNSLEFRNKLGVKRTRCSMELMGVSQRNNRYQSYITINKNNCYLGIYEDKEKAIKIRLLAEQNKHIFNGDKIHFKNYINSLYDLSPMELEDITPQKVTRY